MFVEPFYYVAGALSGAVVGLTLGLFGGGGSILAVPLMVYVVGVPNPHIAIGTSAFAVSANAITNLINHARHGTVKWRCAALYSIAGMIGAAGGSSLGKLIDGQKLLFLFAVLMMIVALFMFKGRAAESDSYAECTLEKLPKLLAFGALTGAFSGFFGIGGGFLIVPALIAATGMPILNAISSSLLAVTIFGLTTSINYAYSGFVDWPLAGLFILGGLGGGHIGMLTSHYLASKKGTLNIAFAGLIFVVAFYMIIKNIATITSLVSS
jgi:uncharacterized membrane protein YfcA